MEAWIVAAVAVLAFLYQVLIGQQSLGQWYRRQAHRAAEEEAVREAAPLPHVGPRRVFGSAIGDGIRFAREHPWLALERAVIGVAVTLGGLVALFLVAGAFLWLVGTAFSMDSAAHFGEHLLTTGALAIGYTVVVAFGLFIVFGAAVIFFAILTDEDGTGKMDTWWKNWRAARKAEKEALRRPVAARTRTRRTRA